MMADLIWLALLALVAARLARLLMFFQQEEYDNERFPRWIFANRAFDVIFSGLCVLALVIGFGLQMSWQIVLVAVAALLIAVRDWRTLGQAKKKLSWTARAKRIFWLAFVIAALPALVTLAMPWAMKLVVSILIVQALPFMLVVANGLWAPWEARNNARFVKEGKAKLAQINPFVVGITGSYGKTTTKHFIAHILAGVAPTLATPGSVNTVLGITRVLREQLRPEHTYFISEMGAYGPGSIARLCALTPPKLSLLTAVGWAHYERFKTLEQVFRTKMEITDAALAQGGPALLAVDSIPAEFLATIPADERERITFVGRPGGPVPVDVAIVGEGVSREGVTLALEIDGKRLAFKAPVYGRFQVDNLALAITAALKLGLPEAAIQAALPSLPQVKHRLNVTLFETGGAVLDDAYNSNPVGFANALDVLDTLAEGGARGRRVLVSPGMVELGAAHAEKHAEIGRHAAPKLDVAVLLGAERMKPFADALEAERAAGRPAPQVVIVETTKEADAWLAANRQPTDHILYENSVPDLYEAKFLL
jgi:UDP-N-acetylmuramoyl-tripeptide--D-alanyl-D-alanine ligase